MIKLELNFDELYKFLETPLLRYLNLIEFDVQKIVEPTSALKI